MQGIRRPAHQKVGTTMGHEDEDERHNRAEDDLDDDDERHSERGRDGNCGRDNDDDDPALVAFGACTNTAPEVLAVGDAVAFSAEGLKKRLDTPDPGHHTFKIERSGNYEFNFMVNGAPATPGAPLVFGLTVNGALITPTLAAGIGLCIGSGIIALKRHYKVRLANNSVSPAGGVTTLSILPGGAANASMSLNRIGLKKC
jgi:hypothetical protein